MATTIHHKPTRQHVPAPCPCDRCNGKRHIVRMEREQRHGTVYVDPVTGYAKWPCEGGVPQRVTYYTGRTVQRLYMCDSCNGSGEGEAVA